MGGLSKIASARMSAAPVIGTHHPGRPVLITLAADNP
jgi:hypothetical protein